MPIAPILLREHTVSSFMNVRPGDQRTFLTLGPEGTSSKHAAEHVAKLWGGRIALFDTYEKAALGVRDDPINNALIVANAYAQINVFYISNNFCPTAAFFHDTPEYIIACRPGASIGKSMVTIATHPAPRHLIAPCLQHSKVTILETDSTRQAAEMALRGEVDGCLTTRTAADILGLETIASVIATIPMLWTIFISKERLKWAPKPL